MIKSLEAIAKNVPSYNKAHEEAKKSEDTDKLKTAENLVKEARGKVATLVKTTEGITARVGAAETASGLNADDILSLDAYKSIAKSSQ